MGRKIEVVIDTEGNAVITTSGFKGGDCLKATMELEKALGVTTEDKKTREFNEQPERTQQQKQSNR
jgi:hypothetical protein